MFREVTAYLLAPVVAFLALRLLPVMWTPLWYASAVVGMSVLCFLALGRCLHRLLPNGVVSASGKAVLITGCDTGFGHSLALRLDRLGYQVRTASQVTGFRPRRAVAPWTSGFVGL